MNLLQRFLHRPNARQLAERERARALMAFAEAVKRGDTRAQHERQAEAKRLTAEVLRMEVGR